MSTQPLMASLTRTENSSRPLPANSWSEFNARSICVISTDMLRVYSETSVWYSTYTTSVSASFTNPTPKCTIAPSKCTALWETYLEEHGMPTTFENATEPAITPVPTDRPRCSVGDVTAKCQPIPTPSCVLIASKVDLYVSVPSQSLPAWKY